MKNVVLTVVIGMFAVASGGAGLFDDGKPGKAAAPVAKAVQVEHAKAWLATAEKLLKEYDPEKVSILTEDLDPEDFNAELAWAKSDHLLMKCWIAGRYLMIGEKKKGMAMLEEIEKAIPTLGDAWEPGETANNVWYGLSEAAAMGGDFQLAEKYARKCGDAAWMVCAISEAMEYAYRYGKPNIGDNLMNKHVVPTYAAWRFKNALDEHGWAMSTVAYNHLDAGNYKAAKNTIDKQLSDPDDVTQLTLRWSLQALTAKAIKKDEIVKGWEFAFSDKQMVGDDGELTDAYEKSLDEKVGDSEFVEGTIGTLYAVRLVMGQEADGKALKAGLLEFEAPVSAADGELLAAEMFLMKGKKPLAAKLAMQSLETSIEGELGGYDALDSGVRAGSILTAAGELEKRSEALKKMMKSHKTMDERMLKAGICLGIVDGLIMESQVRGMVQKKK